MHIGQAPERLSRPLDSDGGAPARLHRLPGRRKPHLPRGGLRHSEVPVQGRGRLDQPQQDRVLRRLRGLGRGRRGGRGPRHRDLRRLPRGVQDGHLGRVLAPHRQVLSQVHICLGGDSFSDGHSLPQVLHPEAARGPPEEGCEDDRRAAEQLRDPVRAHPGRLRQQVRGRPPHDSQDEQKSRQSF